MENLPIQPFSFPLSTKVGKETKEVLPEGNEKNVSFQNILGNLIQQVNDLQENANKSIQELVAGETDSVHQVMIAMQEADLAFRLMMEIRNKLVQAYQEIMRMQM